jgi:hypothetical protein
MVVAAKGGFMPVIVTGVEKKRREGRGGEGRNGTARKERNGRK